jgi:hypothetical protein
MFFNFKKITSTKKYGFLLPLSFLAFFPLLCSAARLSTEAIMQKVEKGIAGDPLIEKVNYMIESYDTKMEEVRAGSDPNQMIKNPKEPGDEGFSLARFAIHSEDIDGLKMLLEKGANPNQAILVGKCGHSLLADAAHTKNIDALKLLLSFDADINLVGTRENCIDPDNGAIWRSDTPIIAAAREGYSDIVKILLAAGADPYKVNSVEENAFEVTTPECAKLLKEHQEKLSKDEL